MTKSEELLAKRRKQSTTSQQPETTQSTIPRSQALMEQRRQNLLNKHAITSQVGHNYTNLKKAITDANTYFNHGAMSQGGHYYADQRQKAFDTMVTKPMTRYLQNGGKIDINDTASLAQLAREQGTPESEIAYLQGRQKAAQLPSTQTIYKPLPNQVGYMQNQLQGVTVPNNTMIKVPNSGYDPVKNYDIQYGKNEAKKTINNLDLNNASTYVNAKADLEKAIAQDNWREIAKNQAIADAYATMYKNEYNKNATFNTELLKDLTDPIKMGANVALTGNLPALKVNKEWDELRNADIKSLKEHTTGAYEDLMKDAEKLNTTIGEAHDKAVEEYKRDYERYLEVKNRYDKAITYDELVNGRPINDFTKNVAVGATGSVAKGMTYGKLAENEILDFFGSARNPANINAKSLLNYNNKNYEIDKYSGGLERETGDTDITGEYQNMTPQEAFSRLKQLATNNPEYRGLKTLLGQISTHSYKGTEQDLAEELDRISREMYQGWKNTHTQAGFDWEEAQREHTERAYADNQFAKDIMNAGMTVGEMIPSMVAGLTGQPASMGALFLSAAGGSADQAINQGATINQGTLYGALSGATEVGTEMIGGENVNRALGIKGKSLLSKVFSDSINNMHIESKAAKVALKYLFDVGGEMLEEAVSEAINPLLKMITYNPLAMPDNVGEYLKNVFDAATEAIPSTILMSAMGAGGKVIQVNRAENSIIEQINNSPLLQQDAKARLIEEVRKAAKDVRLGLTEESGNYKQDIMRNMDMTKAFPNNTPKKVTQPQQNSMGKVVQETAQKETPNLQGLTTRERIQAMQNMDIADQIKYYETTAQKTLPQQTQNALQFLKDNRPGLNVVISDIAIKADGTLKRVQGNGAYVENADGTRTAYINPNATDRAAEFTVIHELAHDLKAGDPTTYGKLKDQVISYAEKLPKYKNSLQALDETYKNAKVKYTLTDEATNDILAEALGDDEFINTLADKQPNLLEQIYNWLKNVLFNGNNTDLTFNQRRMLNKMEQGFRKAYQGKYNKTNNNQEQFFSLIGRDKYNNPIYKSNYGEEVTRKEKNEGLFAALDKIKGKPIRFLVNGRKIMASFDNIGVEKTRYGTTTGERAESTKGMYVKSNLANDLYEIISQSKFIGDGDEPSNVSDVPPKNAAHKDVRKWYTFKNTINYEGELYDVLTTVREKDEGNYTYSVKFFERNKKNSLSQAYDSKSLRDNTRSSYSSNSITSNQHNVNDFQNSLSEQTVDDDKTLAATHNLTEEKLRGILELGGFPVPSIAVSKPDVYKGKNYGDATVFFNKDTIDPANKENEIYSRDIYSPRFPKIEYKINKDTRNAIQKEIVDIAGGYDNLNKNPYLHEAHLDMYDQNLSERLNSFGGQEKFINALSENHRYAYKYWFLKETQPDFTDVLDENGKIDTDKTNEKIDATINQDEYESWLRNKFANIVEKRGLRNNKDYYTNTGTPRSFEALHEDYTLDNVVKIMKALNTTGSESFFMKGFNEVAGTAAKKFNSIQDIKNSQDLLQNVSEENYKELLEPISNRLRDIETDIISKRDEQGLVSNYFIAMDSLGDTIQKVARKSNQKSKLTPNKVIDTMKKDYYDIDTETAQRIIDVIYDMKNLPTQYFESKPQRAVGFDEVNTMLIPNTWSDDTKQQLRDRGINYVEYDPTIEGDREAKYKEAAQDVLFSRSNGEWQQFLDDNFGNFHKNGTRGYFESLPSNEELQQQETKAIENEPIVQANKIAPTKRLDDVRDFKKVGDRKVNAYQYDNPEVKPFFQQEAKNMLQDLNNAIKGERTATWDDYGELHYSGVARETVQDIADLLDGKNGVKLSYADIEKGLNAIIEDKGSENIAAAKRIEMILDKRLREGYTDSYGTKFEPNDNYLNFLAGKDFIDPAEYDKQVQDKLIADYKAQNDDGTLFSLNEEQQKEIDDYADKLFEDKSIDEKYAQEIYNRLGKIQDYSEFEDIKKEVEGKKRSWTKTAKKNELVQEYLDVKDMTYVPESNKKQLDYANRQIAKMGYDEAVKYIDNKINLNERFNANDIAMGELLIQEAIKKGDYDKAQDLISDVAILGTELGQAVQALSLIERMTPEGQLKYLNKVLNKINEKIEKTNTKKSDTKKVANITLDKELANNILKAENPVELQNAMDAALQRIADQMDVPFTDKVAEWRYLAMLANPRTHMRNILANVAMRGTYESKNVIQRAIESLAAPLLDERTRTFKKATADVKKFAEQSMKESAERLSGGKNNTIEARLQEMRKVFKTAPLEKLRRLNKNMLSMEDNVFTQNAYKANLQEYLTANGIKTQHDIDMNPEIVQKGIQFATEEAWKTTFHQMSKFANELNRIENINGFSKLLVGGIVPFKKTPINIAKTGASYSPLGLLETVTGETYKLKTGQINANQYIDRLSQGLTGTALFGLGTLLAKMGILRGSTDKDEEYQENIGQTKSYSIRLGDKNYDISWLSPSAMPLLMGAELVEAAKGEKANIGDMLDAMGKTINPLSEMSLMSGVSSAIQSYNSSDSDFEYLGSVAGNAVSSYFGQFLPTIGGQINKVIDKKQRLTTAGKDSKWRAGERFARQQLSKIPGASYLLEPKTDVWGRDVERDDNPVIRAFDALINPGTVTKDTTTDVDNEILSVFEATGNTDVIPKIPNSKFTYDKEEHKLSAKDYTTYKKTVGQYMYNTYDALLDSEYYKSLSAEDKANTISKISKDSLDVGKAAIGTETNNYFKLDTIRDELDKNGISLVDYYLYARDIKSNDSNTKKKTAIARITENINDKDGKDHITSKDKQVLWDIFGVN